MAKVLVTGVSGVGKSTAGRIREYEDPNSAAAWIEAVITTEYGVSGGGVFTYRLK